MNLDVSSWLQVAILQYGMTVQGSTGTTPGVCPRLPGRPTKANTAAFATHTGFPLPSQASVLWLVCGLEPHARGFAGRQGTRVPGWQLGGGC